MDGFKIRRIIVFVIIILTTTTLNAQNEADSILINYERIKS